VVKILWLVEGKVLVAGWGAAGWPLWLPATFQGLWAGFCLTFIDSFGK